jgi:hypothetical protein
VLAMKRLFLLFMIVLVFVPANKLSAQVHLAFGPRLGLNFATISYDPDVTNKSGRFGLKFGAIGQLEFGRMFAVVIEPMYVVGGNKFDITQGTFTRSLTFLEFPILFKVILLQGNIHPYFFAGPNIGFVLSATDKIEGTQGFDRDTDIKQNISSANFALDFGAGTQYRLAKTIALMGDIRYSLGLSNLLNLQGSTATLKSRAFEIIFGALFYVN